MTINQREDVLGARDTFLGCDEQGIKGARGTGFHRAIKDAIMKGLGQVRNGRVPVSIDVEHIRGQPGGRASFMIFYVMIRVNLQNVHDVIRIGDASADMLEDRNAGCQEVIGVLSGLRPVIDWGKILACSRHSHSGGSFRIDRNRIFINSSEKIFKKSPIFSWIILHSMNKFE